MRTLTREKLEETANVVRQCGGSRREAASKLGVTILTVYNRLHQATALGITVPSGRKGRPPGAKVRRMTPPSKPLAAVAVRPKSRFVTELQKREGWAEYIAGGRISTSLRNDLIEAESAKLQQLAFKMHRQLAGRMEVDDLAAEGAIALIDSAKRFELGRGSFWTFSSQRALGAMLDAARGSDPVGRRVRSLEKQRKSFERDFFNSNGRTPTCEETCSAMGWSRPQWASSHTPAVVSTDSWGLETDSGDIDPFRDILAACDEGPDGHVVSEAFFRDMCNGLPFDIQVYLYLYYVRESTMKSIAAAFGISESRVSQQMSQAKSMLAEKLCKQRAA